MKVIYHRPMATKKEAKKGSSLMLNILAGIIVVFVFGYIIFGNKAPQKPVWNENDRKVTNTGTVNTPAVTPPVTNTGTVTPPTPPEVIVNTPAGRDARDSDPDNEPVVTTGSGTPQVGLSSTGHTDYWNESIGYGFALPRGAYYMGAGARDEAAHSVAIRIGTGVVDFESGEVRTWYFPKKVLPQLAEGEGGKYQDTSSTKTYLKLGSGTLVIQGDFSSPVVNMIIETAKVK